MFWPAKPLITFKCIQRTVSLGVSMNELKLLLIYTKNVQFRLNGENIPEKGRGGNEITFEAIVCWYVHVQTGE